MESSAGTNQRSKTWKGLSTDLTLITVAPCRSRNCATIYRSKVCQLHQLIASSTNSTANALEISQGKNSWQDFRILLLQALLSTRHSCGLSNILPLFLDCCGELFVRGRCLRGFVLLMAKLTNS